MIWRLATGMARETLEAFLSLLYPKRCPACGGGVDEEVSEDFCTKCASGLPWLRAPFCRVCALPFDGLLPGAFRCANCAERRFAFDFAYAPLRGRGAVRELVHRFKYSRQPYLAAPLGRLLGRALAEPRISALISEAIIVPVPLHPRRARERGFNQADLLARELGRASGRPVRTILRRTRYTTTQTAYDREQRMANLRGAFAAATRLAEIKARPVLLIDDVLTTCSTADECARVLKLAGAGPVVALSLARA